MGKSNRLANSRPDPIRSTVMPRATRAELRRPQEQQTDDKKTDARENELR